MLEKRVPKPQKPLMLIKQKEEVKGAYTSSMHIGFTLNTRSRSVEFKNAAANIETHQNAVTEKAKGLRTDATKIMMKT